MKDITQQNSPAPGLAERAKAMLVTPKEEWPKVASESDSVRDVFMRYVVPLAAIGPICGFIGGQLFGFGILGFRYHPTLVAGLSTAITGYVLALLSIFVVAWVANFLADKFGGQENFPRAFRLCAYSFTAAWVVGLVQILPTLGILGLLGLYSLYLFYLGASPMMGVPRDRATGYTAVTLVAAIVVYLVVGAIAAAVTGAFGTVAAETARNDGTGTVEMTLPGYGKVKVENNGDKQTIEVPGMGTIHVTKDGDTVKIDGRDIKAEVKDANSGG